MRLAMTKSAHHVKSCAPARALCEDRWRDAIDYLFALLQVPQFIAAVWELSAEAERERCGSPFRERDVWAEARATKRSRLGDHTSRRRRRIDSLLPDELQFLGAHIVRRESRAAIGELLAGLQVTDRADFKPPPDQLRFLDIAARRAEDLGLSVSDRRYLADWRRRMNPIEAHMRYVLVPDVAVVPGATAAESAAVAGMASSALVAPASGTVIGWVASSPAENGDILVRPAIRDDVEVTERAAYFNRLDGSGSGDDDRA
jgi:hypothetical protein